jgi:hypothetical protein
MIHAEHPHSFWLCHGCQDEIEAGLICPSCHVVLCPECSSRPHAGIDASGQPRACPASPNAAEQAA